ncbi:hypothetical protein N9D23_08460 [Rubripirellula sp.]|nr:hypothetical protein [Rubripirellula sp.]
MFTRSPFRKRLLHHCGYCTTAVTAPLRLLGLLAVETSLAVCGDVTDAPTARKLLGSHYQRRIAAPARPTCF